MTDNTEDKQPETETVHVADVLATQFKLMDYSPPGSAIEVLVENARQAMTTLMAIGKQQLDKGNKDTGLHLLQLAVGLGPAVYFNPNTGRLEGSYVALDATGAVVERSLEGDVPATQDTTDLPPADKSKLH